MEEVNQSSLDEVNSSSPAIRENTGRDENGRFMPGVSGNPIGRPKNSMKEYLRKKFNDMTDEQKEQWLKDYNVSGEVMFKMAEGNPDNKSDITSDGEKLQAGVIILPSKNDTEPTE